MTYETGGGEKSKRNIKCEKDIWIICDSISQLYLHNWVHTKQREKNKFITDQASTNIV